MSRSASLSCACLRLAAAIRPRYVEGSGGRLLLREDLTVENVLPGRRGRAKPHRGPGLGVHVKEETLAKLTESEQSLEAEVVETR